MPDWLEGREALLGWLAIVSVVTFVGTLVAMPWLVARIPSDYFMPTRRHRTPWSEHHPVIRVTLAILKNLAGVVFVLAGVAMIFLPGQGVITILIGVVLMDFPGKYRLERWIVAKKPVHRSIDWLRRRAGRKPLELPEEMRA